MTEDGQEQGTQDGEGAPAAEAGALPPAGPEERLAALQAERDEIKDRLLRVAAEFENFKKRARVTAAEGEANVRERVLKDVLDIADNLERATEAGQGADRAAVLEGVKLVLRLLQQKLERYEVRHFEAKGQPFDPRLHEAISRVENAEVPAGNVAAVLQKGYKIGEKLLRPAMVSVSTGPGNEAKGGGESGE
jgi:molecular chaperone GrpE